MSEKLPSIERYERSTSAHFEHISGAEAHSAKAELAAVHHEKARQLQLEQARSTIESQAEASQRVLDNQVESNKAHTPHYISSDLRSLTSQRALQRVRKSMSKIDRVTSVVIHTKPVRALSDTSARTVARPFPLLLGGLFAFIGTTSYLIFTRYIGVEYNYFVWTLLFLTGFAVGMAVDAARSLARRK